MADVVAGNLWWSSCSSWSSRRSSCRSSLSRGAGALAAQRSRRSAYARARGSAVRPLSQPRNEPGAAHAGGDRRVEPQPDLCYTAPAEDPLRRPSPVAAHRRRAPTACGAAGHRAARSPTSLGARGARAEAAVEARARSRPGACESDGGDRAACRDRNALRAADASRRAKMSSLQNCRYAASRRATSARRLGVFREVMNHPDIKDPIYPPLVRHLEGIFRAESRFDPEQHDLADADQPAVHRVVPGRAQS